jgi:hypothetical protein
MNTVYTKDSDISGMKKQKNFRFDEKLMDMVQKLADKDKRSLTNYIEKVLWEKVEQDKVRKAKG